MQLDVLSGLLSWERLDTSAVSMSKVGSYCLLVREKRVGHRREGNIPDWPSDASEREQVSIKLVVGELYYVAGVGSACCMGQ